MPTMRSYLEVTHQAQGSQEEEEELYNYYMLLLPVVPHKAVAEVSKIGNL